MKPRLPWRLLLLAVLVVSLSTQPVFLLGAGFLRIGGELGFSATGLGLLTALFFLTASVVSPALGKVVENIGWRRAIRLNAVASSVLLLAIAAFARSTLTLGFLLVVAAVVYGLSNPSANLTLAEHVDPSRRALIFGLKHAGIPASTLLSGLAVPALVLSVGWRWAYVAAATLGIVVMSLVPVGPRPPPLPPGAEDPRRRVAPLTMGRLVGLGAGSALATWAAISLSTYLVAAAVDVGFSESAAGLLLFAGSASSIAGRVVAGLATDRAGSAGFGAFVALLSAGALVFLFLPVSSGRTFAVLILAAFATGWGWPGIMTYTVVNANRGTVASSSAITQSGVFVGAGVAPPLLGWVADQFSFDAVWLVVTAALTAAALVVSLVGRVARAAT